MKQFFFTVPFIIMMLSDVKAQTANPKAYEMNYKAHQIQLLQKAGISLTNSQSDSVGAIEYEIWQQIRTERGKSGNARINWQSLDNYKKQRLTAALKDATLAGRIADYFTSVRKERETKMAKDSTASH